MKSVRLYDRFEARIFHIALRKDRELIVHEIIHKNNCLPNPMEIDFISSKCYLIKIHVHVCSE